MGSELLAYTGVLWKWFCYLEFVALSFISFTVKEFHFRKPVKSVLSLRSYCFHIHTYLYSTFSSWHFLNFHWCILFSSPFPFYSICLLSFPSSSRGYFSAKLCSCMEISCLAQTLDCLVIGAPGLTNNHCSSSLESTENHLLPVVPISSCNNCYNWFEWKSSEFNFQKIKTNCTAFHCIALHSIAFYCIPFHCILVCIKAAFHFIAFHCIVLHLG